MSYFVCLDLDHVKKDMPTKSGVFFLNGLTFHKHKMDALISQSTHYTQFIYEPNLIPNRKRYTYGCMYSLRLVYG